jgi:hypothetical protein
VIHKPTNDIPNQDRGKVRRAAHLREVFNIEVGEQLVQKRPRYKGINEENEITFFDKDLEGI